MTCALFRVDASLAIGSGHIMRCLTLANALQEQGWRTGFICRHLPEALQQQLQALAHQVIVLPATAAAAVEDIGPELTHAHWLGVSQSVDAQQTQQAIADQCCQWLIVDHYALDQRWQARFVEQGLNVMVIDDLYDRQHQGHLLLNQNIAIDASQSYQMLVPASMRCLLGPDYALLRPEFMQQRQRSAPRTGPLTQVLVFMGGMDATNSTAQAVQGLIALQQQGQLPTGVGVQVVIGNQHPQRRQLVPWIQHHGFVCHVQTKQMAQLMAQANFALGAAGSASWERCCLGLPTAMLTLADNQMAIAQAIAQHGAGWYLGMQHQVSADDWANSLQRVLDQPQQIAQLSQQAWQWVDGLGVSRVIQQMQQV